MQISSVRIFFVEEIRQNDRDDIHNKVWDWIVMLLVDLVIYYLMRSGQPSSPYYYLSTGGY